MGPTSNQPIPTMPCKSQHDQDMMISSNFQEPRMSRHRGVLLLRPSVDVFDMRSCSSDSVDDIMSSSINAQCQFKANRVSTQQLRKRVDGSGLSDLEIILHEDRFYGGDVVNDKSISCQVTIPATWSPRLFLAILNSSIRTFKVISLETVVSGSLEHVTVNTVHCYHDSYDIKKLHYKILMKGGYIGITGGYIIE